MAAGQCSKQTSGEGKPPRISYVGEGVIQVCKLSLNATYVTTFLVYCCLGSIDAYVQMVEDSTKRTQQREVKSTVGCHRHGNTLSPSAIHGHPRHLAVNTKELEPVLDIQRRGRNRCIANGTRGPPITVVHLHSSTHHA